MHNSKFRIHNSKGYTLVEMLLFMGLFSMFLVVLSNMYSTILETQQRSLATSYVELSGRYILARLLYDIPRADSVQTPDDLGEEETSMVLRKDGEDTTYAIATDVMELTNSGGTFALHSNEVTASNLQITRIGNVNGEPTLLISFEITSVIPDTTGIHSRTFSTTVGTR